MRPATRRLREEYAHEHCLSPPFDEDDELDLRAVYRKPRTGGSPELDAAVRRTWHPGHSWHPGWAAAACAALVAGLFAWTDMRENAEMIDMTPQLAVSQEAEASPERAPAPRLVGTDAPAPQQAAARKSSAPRNRRPSRKPTSRPSWPRPSRRPRRRRWSPRPNKPPAPSPLPSATRTSRRAWRTSVP